MKNFMAFNLITLNVQIDDKDAELKGLICLSIINSSKHEI